MGNGGWLVRMTSCTRSAWRIFGIWRKLGELRLDTERDGWLSLARKALWQVSHEMGARWKSQNRKIVPLSPYVEKPLNSKVIKSFVPEQRSRYAFFEFRDSYVLCYICNEQSMYVSHSRIWLWYTFSGLLHFTLDTYHDDTICIFFIFFNSHLLKSIQNTFDVFVCVLPQREKDVQVKKKQETYLPLGSFDAYILKSKSYWSV